MTDEEIPTPAALAALAIIICDLAKRSNVSTSDLISDVSARSIVSKMTGDKALSNALNAFGKIIAGEAGKPTSDGMLSDLEAKLTKQVAAKKRPRVIPKD